MNGLDCRERKRRDAPNPCRGDGDEQCVLRGARGRGFPVAEAAMRSSDCVAEREDSVFHRRYRYPRQQARVAQ